jgi:catechol 2,3-dioxygenase-like lactoylglutathione lyase family enzyme
VLESAFDQLNIVCGDLDATVSFYRRLGLPMGEPARTEDGAPFHASSRGEAGAWLEADSPAFARFWNKGWLGEADLNGRVLIVVRVASRPEVDRLYGDVTAAGHRSLQQPLDAFWGARFAIVEDPNRLAVGLMSPADDAHRAPLDWP